jgi:hypothetical protein
VDLVKGMTGCDSVRSDLVLVMAAAKPLLADECARFNFGGDDCAPVSVAHNIDFFL